MDFTARYFLITEDEAKSTWPDNHEDYWSVHRQGYVAGYVPGSQLKGMALLTQLR